MIIFCKLIKVNKKNGQRLHGDDDKKCHGIRSKHEMIMTTDI